MLLSFPYLVRAEAFCGLTRAEAFCGLTLMPAASPFLTGWVLTVFLIYTMPPLGPGIAPRMAIMFSSASTLTMSRFWTVICAAVAGGRTALAEALDNAGVAVTLADTGDVDLVAFREHVGLHDVADLELAGILKTELLEMLDHAHAGFLQVTLLAVRELLLGYFLVTELDCLVSFLFLGHLLHDHAGAGLDDGHGNDLASLIEDLRHADLLADDGFLHCISS